MTDEEAFVKAMADQNRQVAEAEIIERAIAEQEPAPPGWVPSCPAHRTNGDRVEPVVERAKQLLAEGVQWAREHPDEAFVAIAPWVLLTLATRRHRLTYTEAAIVTEVGYWSGLLVLQHYRQWKTRPAAGRSLREVI